MHFKSLFLIIFIYSSAFAAQPKEDAEIYMPDDIENMFFQKFENGKIIVPIRELSPANFEKLKTFFADSKNLLAVTKDKRTFAMLAATNESHSFTQYIFATKQKIHAVDISGWNMFHHAASDGQMHVFRQLLDSNNFDINAQTKSGETPLDLTQNKAKNQASFSVGSKDPGTKARWLTEANAKTGAQLRAEKK